MNLVQFALRRPLTIVVLMVAALLGAAIALKSMTRDIFPPLGSPTIYVAQPYGGMDPAQMEGFLSYYYEYHFLYIGGIEHVESKSIQGASLIKLQFHPGTDMSAALAETVAYVNRARAFMPLGTPGPFVTRFDAGSVPVGYLVFSTRNEARSVGQMQDAALNQVRPLFATLPGVSAPPPFGGSARTVVVNLKPDRLRAYGLSPDDVVAAMARSNVLSPSGNINLGDLYPIVLANGIVRNVKELEATPLRRTAEGMVYVRDVASVDDAADLVTSYALVDGRRTVYLPVTKRSEASTLAVIEQVRASLPKFRSVVADDIEVSYEFDQSPVVWHAIGDLAREGLLGALLTGLMVLLFLRDWRSALTVVVNIPLSLLAASFALWLSGQNVNLMTLSGLALAIGILVDEATVTIENVHSHLARGVTVARAVRDATEETVLPRLLAMLCVAAVFLPAFLMTGAAKALFVPLALAIGFSMIASYLLSSTLVPVLLVWLLRRDSRAGSTAHGGARFQRFQARHGERVARLVGLRWMVVGLYLMIAITVAAFAGSRLGVEIFPKIDTGQLALRLKAPAGTRLELTEQFALRALALIKREAGEDRVGLSLGLVGVHAPNYPVNLIHQWNGGPEEAWLAIQLKAGSGIAVEALEENLRAAFARELPELRISFEPADIVNRVMSFGSTTPIEVAVSGGSFPATIAHARKIEERLKQIPALRDVQLGQTLDFPAVNVDVDRERAGQLGVDMSSVTRSLVAATTSSRFTLPNFWSDPTSGIGYNLQIQIPQARTQSTEDLGNLPVSDASGQTVLLRNIASISSGTTVGQYARYNGARVVSVTANLHGAALGSVIAEVERAIAGLGPPPPKASVAIRGQAIPLAELRDGFGSGLLLSVVVILLLLAANFQSIPLSLAVLSTTPAVIAGVALVLWLTGTTLNIQSATGAIMAIGVAVANAILVVTFAERSRLAGRSAEDAAIDAARSRLRPILMTSAAMLSGMVPLAIGFGQGGDQVAPLGRAVIGGLAAATLATLFVLPAVYTLLRQRANTLAASLDPDDASSHHYLATATDP